jgi:osmotically-inducible protein OsmY
MTRPAVVSVLRSEDKSHAAKDAPAETGSHSTECLGDLRLAERVERAVRATGYPSLRAIEVAACERLVILRGRVPSYYMKQMAQATAVAVPGVCELRNDLDVVAPTRPTGGMLHARAIRHGHRSAR